MHDEQLGTYLAETKRFQESSFESIGLQRMAGIHDQVVLSKVLVNVVSVSIARYQACQH